MKRLAIIAASLMMSATASAQSLYIKNDAQKAIGPKVHFSVFVKNYNSYTQSYNIVRNGEQLDGELTLKPNESRTIRVVVDAKRDQEVIHRICLKAIPLPTQMMGMSLCQNVKTY